MFQLVSYVAVYSCLLIITVDHLELMQFTLHAYKGVPTQKLYSFLCNIIYYVHIQLQLILYIIISNALVFLIIQLPMFLNQVHTLFHKSTFVWEVSMCFCVYPPLRVLITSGMIWIPYDWLNKKFYSFCMAFVVDVLRRYGFGSKVHHRN